MVIGGQLVLEYILPRHRGSLFGGLRKRSKRRKQICTGTTSQKYVTYILVIKVPFSLSPLLFFVLRSGCFPSSFESASNI